MHPWGSAPPERLTNTASVKVRVITKDVGSIIEVRVGTWSGWHLSESFKNGGGARAPWFLRPWL